MTSPARGGPDAAGMRESLARELYRINGHEADGPWESVPEYAWIRSYLVGQAAALLPVVQRLAVEKAAEELRAAADELVKDGRPDLTTIDQVQAVNDAAAWLDARADALEKR